MFFWYENIKCFFVFFFFQVTRTRSYKEKVWAAWEVEDYEWLPGGMITLTHDIEILVSMQHVEMKFGYEAKHRTEDHGCVNCTK